MQFLSRFYSAAPPGRAFALQSSLLALPIALLIAVNAVSFGLLQQLSSDAAAVEKSQAALLAGQEFLSSLKDAETGQRGFLLTGRSYYLQPYYKAVAAFGDYRRRLVYEFNDDFASDVVLHRVVELSLQKMSEIGETIALYKEGKRAAALDLVNTDKGKRAMDEIQQLMAGLNQSKRRALAREQASRGKSRYALFLLLVFGGSSVICILFACSYILRALLIAMRSNEEHLERSLTEKETMLREIHHRVKNNLQVISSLLRMQGSLLQDEQAKEALKISQRRVATMALIHDRLYGNRRLDEIDFTEYAKSLVDELVHSYAGPSGNITGRVKASRVLLNVGQAIPCGLILNELVTNAIKHAYPDGKSGEIVIHLEEPCPGNVRLSVADHGVGLPEGFDWENSKSMGLPIVESLAEQVGGKLEVQSQGGATFTLEFARELRNAAVA